jgi:hypothetical protein
MLTLTAIALLLTTTAAYAARTPAEKVARTITATWTCQDTIGVPRTKAPNVWQKHSPGYRKWQLRVWRARLEVCRQWNWQAWLPANWVAVARCETGINWRHGNRSYVSAFGIQRGSFNGAYDSDARKVGMPPWNDRNPPTPWAQYQTALSHYRSFGDGWGCPGP